MDASRLRVCYNIRVTSVMLDNTVKVVAVPDADDDVATDADAADAADAADNVASG